MIRRVEGLNSLNYREFRVIKGNLEMRGGLSDSWMSIAGSYANDMERAIQAYLGIAGWKEVTSAVDPNDLQGNCDHRKYDVHTDACAICGKDWNTILWSPVDINKPCCGGGLNSALPAQYSGGKWHSIDCDTLKPALAVPGASSTSIDYSPKAAYKRCECGAASTSNPNCHATYCPEYKK